MNYGNDVNMWSVYSLQEASVGKSKTKDDFLSICFGQGMGTCGHFQMHQFRRC